MSSAAAANGSEHASIESLREETRRSMLAKAGLAASGVGLMTLARAGSASAGHHAGDTDLMSKLDFDGFNNIKHFGASPSASASTNHSAIQQCIDASAGNAAVWVPPGTYLINAELKLSSQTVLIGNGSLSVIKASGFTETNAMIGIKNPTGNPPRVEDIRIENLTLDGNKDSETAIFSLIAIRRFDSVTAHCDRIVVRGLELKNTTGFAGVYFQNVRLGTIENCHVHDGNRSDLFGNAGIQVQGLCEDVLIRGNLVHNFTDDCIAVTSAVETGGFPRRTSVVGNVANAPDTKMGAAIAVDAASEVLIAGNVCAKGRHAGIDIRAAQGFSARDIEVADNVVIEGGRSSNASGTGHQGGKGIYLWLDSQYHVSRVVVRDNLITTPRHHGISLFQNGSNVGTLSDITVSGNKIWVDTQATDLEGNGAGISLDSPNGEAISDIRITDNDIYGTDGPGISVAGRPTALIRRCDIQGNRIEKAGTTDAPRPANDPGAGKRGISLYSVTDATVSNNRTHDIQTTELDEDHIAIRRGTRVAVNGNTVDATSASAGSCVSVYGTSEAVVTGNILRGGALGGVRVETAHGQPCERVIVSDNLILESGNSNISGAQANYSDIFGIGVLLRANNESGAPKLQDIKITDNVITQFRKYGVWPDASAGGGGISDVQILNNTIAITDTAAAHLSPQLGQGIHCRMPSPSVLNLKIEGNRIRDMFEEGIYLLGDSTSLIQGVFIRNNEVNASGKSGAPKPGIYTSGAWGQVFVSNNCWGATHSAGIEVESPRGTLEVQHNRCINSGTPFKFTGSSSYQQIRVRDNIGFNPWNGSVTVSGPWDMMSSPAAKTVTVTFGVKFSAVGPSVLPKVYLTTNEPGVGASVISVSESSFTAKCWTYQAMPTSDPVINWLAEPAGSG